MRFNGLSLITLLTSAVVATSSFANITLSGSSEPNVCKNIVGKWTGSGMVYAKIGAIDLNCGYRGDAVVRAQKADDFTNFIFDIALTNTSGGCPSGKTFSMTGVCNDKTGVMTLQNNEANLTGVISKGGNAADINGTVNVTTPIGVVSGVVRNLHIDKIPQ